MAKHIGLGVVLVLAIAPLTTSAQQSMTYELTFDSTWSAATHPNEFPPSPHFSGLIGGTHSDQVVFWEPGGIATQGIELMAELGSKFALQQEVEQAITDGHGGEVISGGGIALSPGSVSVEFTATQDHDLVSVVTMIAPSPDWFLGVHGVSLRPNGQWVNELVVQLQPYDSGTDSGPTYTSPNADITPHIPIIQMTGLPFVTEGPVPPLGTFTFTRVGPLVPATSSWGLLIMALLVAIAGTRIYLGYSGRTLSAR